VTLLIYERERTIFMSFLIYWVFYLLLEKEYSFIEFALHD